MASSDTKWEMNCDDFKCIEDLVVGELGGGAQSIVRLTLHTTLGPVAVKCFSVTGGPPDRRRLESKLNRELQILQKAANEFIVNTHGWVKWSKAMGLVMEYLPVGSIRQFTIDSFAKLTPKVILRMAYEIASAIAYMHNPLGDHRVVHGDLKPENVLLTKDLRCKVGDFGSAELAELTGGATLTSGPKREKPSMTLAYAAPEKLKKKNIEPKKEQDTYSFGMLLYALLTGSAPYTQTYQESRFIESIIRGERPDTDKIGELKEAASTDDKQIIEVLESIMKKCWQQEPSDRPDMIKVRDQLQELRDQQNDADTLAEVVELLRGMSFSPPVAKEQKLVPLHQFSPINGKFAGEGTVYNIYNLPNVQQAAINCNVVEFEQDASAEDEANNNSFERSVPVDTVPESHVSEKSTSNSALRKCILVIGLLCILMFGILLVFSFFNPADTPQVDNRSEQFFDGGQSSSIFFGARQDVQQSNRDVSEVPSRSSVCLSRSFFGEHEALDSSSDSAVNTAKQQGRQQTATTTKADDRKSNAETSTRKSLKVDKKKTYVKEQAGPTSSAKDVDSKLPSERKPTLSEVFESSDPSGSPSNVQPAPGFLETYKVSLKNQKYEEAKAMTTAITSMIEDNIDATAKDVKKFGRKLREKKLFLESIAIFDAASAMFEKMGKTEENLQLIKICVGEMKDTNEAMIGDDASTKVTVKNFVIPLMREKLRHIEDTSLVSEQFKCRQVCWVLHIIEYSEYLVDEWEEREQTLRSALTRMKDVFKADALKFRVYGGLLNNLGHVCRNHKSRFEEAASFFQQAIDAKKAATDYSDEEERKKHIANSEKNLKVVQQRMK